MAPKWGGGGLPMSFSAAKKNKQTEEKVEER